MSIPLSKEHGINPALTICPRCRGEGRDLVLAGNSNKWKCLNCDRLHVVYVGQALKMECECGNRYRNNKSRWENVGKFDGSKDKAIGGLCEACEKEMAEHKKIVEAGGVYWRCKDCGSSGVIKADSDYSKAVRKELGIAPPKPGGVEFDSNACPICKEKKEA